VCLFAKKNRIEHLYIYLASALNKKLMLIAKSFSMFFAWILVCRLEFRSVALGMLP
jgi:hypothetical protein